MKLFRLWPLVCLIALVETDIPKADAAEKTKDQVGEELEFMTIQFFDCIYGLVKHSDLSDAAKAEALQHVVGTFFLDWLAHKASGQPCQNYALGKWEKLYFKEFPAAFENPDLIGIAKMFSNGELVPGALSLQSYGLAWDEIHTEKKYAEALAEFRRAMSVLK